MIVDLTPYFAWFGVLCFLTLCWIAATEGIAAIVRVVYDFFKDYREFRKWRSNQKP